jgi:hypothetical protein
MHHMQATHQHGEGAAPSIAQQRQQRGGFCQPPARPPPEGRDPPPQLPATHLPGAFFWPVPCLLPALLPALLLCPGTALCSLRTLPGCCRLRRKPLPAAASCTASCTAACTALALLYCLAVRVHVGPHGCRAGVALPCRPISPLTAHVQLQHVVPGRTAPVQVTALAAQLEVQVELAVALLQACRVVSEHSGRL